MPGKKCIGDKEFEHLEYYDLQNTFRAFIVHWTMDPERGEEWEADQRRLNQGSEADFEQQFNIAFSTVTGQPVFSSYNEELHAAELLKYQKNLPLLLCCDFNINPMAWAIAQYHPADHQVHFIDEIFLMPGTTETAADQFIDYYSDHPGAVYVYGDPAGNQRQQADGKSNFDKIRAKLKPHFPGLKINVPRKHYGVKDSVASVNMMLVDIHGVPHIKIDPQACPNLCRDFADVVWTDDNKSIKKAIDPKNPYYYRTHMAEGVRNMIHRRWPVERQIKEADPAKKKKGIKWIPKSIMPKL
jgi:hypothetical protein